MKVLYFAPMENGVCERLQQKIEAVIPAENMEIYRTFEDLSERFHQPLNNLSVAVLLAASREDLQELLSIRDLITDVRLIAVLPDRKKETIAKGHLLRPRYLAYADGDFADVVAVLRKMLENINNNSIYRKGGE